MSSSTASTAMPTSLAGGNATASANLESSFASILSRTQQNLHRINQRYAPATANTTTTNPPTVPLQNPIAPMLSSQPTAALLSRFQAPQASVAPGPQPPGPSNVSSGRNAVPNTGNTSVTIDEQLLMSMLDRISQLEHKTRRLEDDNDLLRRPAATSSSTQQHIFVEKYIDPLALDVKDVQRQLGSLAQRLTSTQSVFDSLLHDSEQRHTSASKTDHWMQEQDLWRDTIDRQCLQLRKDYMSFEQDKRELQQNMSQLATKYDLDLLRDKTHLSAQQSIAASMQVWNEQVDAKIKLLERDLALVRVSQHQAVQKEMQLEGSTVMSAEAVSKVLGTPVPSEILLKGVVASEVMQVQQALEDKLNHRFEALLKHEVSTAKQQLVSQIQKQVLAISVEAMLFANPAHTGAVDGSGHRGGGSSGLNMMMMHNQQQANAAAWSSLESKDADLEDDADSRKLRQDFERRVAASKSKWDAMERNLLDKITYVTRRLEDFETAYRSEEKTKIAQYVSVENKSELALEKSQFAVTECLNRCQSLEQFLRQEEDGMKQKVDRLQYEVQEKLTTALSDLSNDRIDIERRLLIAERVSQDCLQAQKHYNDLIDTHVRTHPIILQAQQQQEGMQALQSQLQLMQHEVREQVQAVLKLSATTVSINEFHAVQEQVLHIDHLVKDKYPDYFESTRKLLDSVQNLQQKLSAAEHMLQVLSNESTNAKTKLQALDLQMVQWSGNSSLHSEELKLFKQRLQTAEQRLDKDIPHLKDLTGNMSSQVQSFNSKLLDVNRTSGHEMKSIRQLIQQLEDNIKTSEEKIQKLQEKYEQVLLESVAASHRYYPTAPSSSAAPVVASGSGATPPPTTIASAPATSVAAPVSAPVSVPVPVVSAIPEVVTTSTAPSDKSVSSADSSTASVKSEKGQDYAVSEQSFSAKSNNNIVNEEDDNVSEFSQQEDASSIQEDDEKPAVSSQSISQNNSSESEIDQITELENSIIDVATAKPHHIEANSSDEHKSSKNSFDESDDDGSNEDVPDNRFQQPSTILLASQDNTMLLDRSQDDNNSMQQDVSLLKEISLLDQTNQSSSMLASRRGANTSAVVFDQSDESAHEHSSDDSNIQPSQNRENMSSSFASEPRGAISKASIMSNSFDEESVMSTSSSPNKSVIKPVSASHVHQQSPTAFAESAAPSDNEDSDQDNSVEDRNDHVYDNEFNKGLDDEDSFDEDVNSFLENPNQPANTASNNKALHGSHNPQKGGEEGESDWDESDDEDEDDENDDHDEDEESDDASDVEVLPTVATSSPAASKKPSTFLTYQDTSSQSSVRADQSKVANSFDESSSINVERKQDPPKPVEEEEQVNTGAPLSIRDRLRLKQEQLRKERMLKESEEGTLSSSSNSAPPSPTKSNKEATTKSTSAVPALALTKLQETSSDEEGAPHSNRPSNIRSSEKDTKKSSPVRKSSFDSTSESEMETSRELAKKAAPSTSTTSKAPTSQSTQPTRAASNAVDSSTSHVEAGTSDTSGSSVNISNMSFSSSSYSNSSTSSVSKSPPPPAYSAVTSSGNNPAKATTDPNKSTVSASSGQSSNRSGDNVVMEFEEFDNSDFDF